MLELGVTNLMLAFDDDEGVNEKGFEAALNLIQVAFGPTQRDEFSKLVNATDGRFYLKEDTDVAALVKKWKDGMQAPPNVIIDQVDYIAFYVHSDSKEFYGEIGGMRYEKAPPVVIVDGVKYEFAHDEYHGSRTIRWHYERIKT